MEKAKRVLVTGSEGFIGSHLTEMLLEEGFEVTALVLYNSFNNWGWLEGNRHKNLKVVTGDVRDPYFCNQITKNIDIVFHLAALIAIPYSYVAPESYVDTNVKGTLNILEGAKSNGVKRVLVTSTSEIYGTAQYVPIDEKHPKQPQSPYSATKIAADSLALSYFNAFELPVTIVRPFNAYGPRQSARAIIPTIISQIANGETCIKVGDLTPTRDFNYVTDLCKGFILISECSDLIGKEVNIATNSEISMGDTLNLIAEIMGKSVTFIQDPNRLRPKNSEVFRLFGDATLLRTYTDFCPLWSIKDGLEATIQWILEPKNLSTYKSNIYNI